VTPVSPSRLGSLRLLGAAVAAIPLVVAPVRAEIRLGMSAALSGPAQEVGRQMALGVEVCLAEINSAGGVNGEMVRLIPLDDGYEPARAGPNTRALIHEQNVTALIGSVGTPTAVVAAPIASESRTLFFGAYTGAEMLRIVPPNRYVVNFRASYAEETAALIHFLLSSGIRPEEIAFFTQRDGFGDDGYRGAVRALRAHGFDDVERLVHGRYTRNTLNVQGALAEFLDAPVPPKAVIMVGGYRSSAEFIRLARHELPQLIFLHVSFGGAGALVRELGPDSEGIIVSQVVPAPDADLPMVGAYRDALRRFAPEEQPDLISLEGYIVARLMALALVRAGHGADSERLTSVIASMGPVDVGLGAPLTLVPSGVSPPRPVWLSRVVGGRFVTIGDTPLVVPAAPTKAPDMALRR
jgi:ABC-type branched-subunit amino acid transport system substrate-binding protein